MIQIISKNMIQIISNIKIFRIHDIDEYVEECVNLETLQGIECEITNIAFHNLSKSLINWGYNYKKDLVYNQRPTGFKMSNRHDEERIKKFNSLAGII